MYDHTTPLGRLLALVTGPPCLVVHSEATRRLFVWPGTGTEIALYDDATIEPMGTWLATVGPLGEVDLARVRATITERVNAGY